MQFSDIKLTKRDIDDFSGYQRLMFFPKVDGGFPVSMDEINEEMHRIAISKIFIKKFNKKPTAIDSLARRTLHFVYKVHTEGKDYIIRINASGEFFHELQYIIELWAFEQLKLHGLPALEIFDIDVSRNLMPFDYEIMSVAEGKSIYDASIEGSFKIEMIKQLGAMAASIHKIKTKGYGHFDIGSLVSGEHKGAHDNWCDFVLMNLTKHLEYCTLSGIITENDASNIQSVLNYPEGFCLPEPSLLHGDMANHNAFTDGEKITALIDWEESMSGDPIFEIAYYGTGCYGNEEWLNAFLEGYKSVTGLPEDFERRYAFYYLRISVAKALVRDRFAKFSDIHLPNIKERILFALSQIRKFL